jgi:hypothetical protein
MSVNHPRHEEGVVLTDVTEIVKEAEKNKPQWPELEEPVFSDPPFSPQARSEYVMWVMVALVGAVTVYGLVTDNMNILMAVLTFAGGYLLRLAGLAPTDKGEKHSDQRRTREPSKKRRRSS